MTPPWRKPGGSALSPHNPGLRFLSPRSITPKTSHSRLSYIAFRSYRSRPRFLDLRNSYPENLCSFLHSSDAWSCALMTTSRPVLIVIAAQPTVFAEFEVLTPEIVFCASAVVASIHLDTPFSVKVLNQYRGELSSGYLTRLNCVK